MEMRSNQKKGEDKEGNKDEKPERARRMEHGSSNISPADIKVHSEQEINRIRILSRVQRPSNEQVNADHERVMQRLGINQNSEPVDINKQTAGDEGKGASKQTPGDVDEESKSTMPISKETGTEINIGKILKDIFEPSERG
jgi:hypothetical protein